MFLLGVLSVCVLAVAATGGTFQSPWLTQLFSPYVLEFLAGVFVWKLTTLHTASALFSRMCVAGGVLSMAITAAMELGMGREAQHWNLIYAASAMPLVYGLVSLSSNSSGRKEQEHGWRNPLLVLGRYSYSIYLFHYPFEQIAVRTAVKFSGPSPGPLVIWLAALFAAGAGLGAGLLIGRFVEIPLLEASKRWIRGLDLTAAK